MKFTASTIAAWLLALLGIAAAREAKKNAEHLSGVIEDLMRTIGNDDGRW